jgi:Flp pilus assembly protein TadD
MTDNSENFFETHREIVISVALIVLALAIFLQTNSFDFINLDDSVYVYDNPVVLSGLNSASIKWAFTTFHAGNWHPLVWLSLLLDVQLFGANAGKMHMVNVGLHSLNAILAFLVFRRMSGKVIESAIVAALFTVYPTHVESVAWITERKDVLSTAFWFLTMLSYVTWCRKGSKVWDRWYFITLAVLAVGLSAKQMLVTLPAVLILCDIWPLDRASVGGIRANWRLFTEKIPFFVLSIASGLMTVTAQRFGGAVQSFTQLPLDARMQNAVVSYAKYVLWLFYPVDLAVWYPLNRNIEVWQVVIASILLLAITVICIRQFPTRKYLPVGWLWYLGTLLPVSGVMQAGDQAMADRYTYIPYFGLFIMLVWGVSEVLERLGLSRRIFYVAAGCAIVLLTLLSYSQTTYWVNSEKLFRRTLAVTGSNYLISHNLCDYLTFKDRPNDAEPFCVASKTANPTYFPAYNTLGMLQIKRQQFALAEANFKKTLEIAPEFTVAYSNLATAQILQGNPEQAEGNLDNAIAMTLGTPTSAFVRPLTDLGSAFAAKKNYQKAYDAWTRAIALKPDDSELQMKLAAVLFKLERFDEAQLQIERVVAANPNNPSAHNTYGRILLEKKQFDQAAIQFEAALRLKPDFAEAMANLQTARTGK